MNTSSDISEVYGIENNEVTVFGIFGISSYAYVRDLLSDEAMQVGPTMFPIKDSRLTAMVWKIENEYLTILVVPINGTA